MIARTKDGILEDVLNEMSEVAEKQKHKEIIEYVVKLLYEDEIKPLQDELIALENKSFNDLAKDMIKYLNTNHHPHTRIIVDSSSCEIVEGLKCFYTTEYIRD